MWLLIHADIEVNPCWYPRPLDYMPSPVPSALIIIDIYKYQRYTMQDKNKLDKAMNSMLLFDDIH